MKEIIIKKDDNEITLIDKDDIQDRINKAIADNTPDWVNLLITYDDDTTETLQLQGHAWNSGDSNSSGDTGDD